MVQHNSSNYGLTDPNEIFKAKINIRQGKAYNGKTGYIFQWGKEK